MACMPFVYILRCHDGSYYTGSTDRDPEQREWEHNHDDEMAANYTRKRRPVYLVYSEQFERIEDTYQRERQLHGWSRRKEALVLGRPEELPALSRPSTSSGSGAGSG
ncbi:MAG: GIY-YIG nuclease family protein [Candidatus Cloacimonetes bacterium]|nr:GIY-YIG nuclease family protein [Candidatus Cloacimonadota bacterium]